jgi:uncharacterized protein (UPF0335 family)
MKFLTDKRFLIFIVALLILVVAVVILIPRVKKQNSVVNSDLVEYIDKENRIEVEKVKKEATDLRKEVFDKIKNDSILFDKKTKEIIELKSQLKLLKIENEKKHIINSNTTTDESSLILRNNIKKRTEKGN